MTQRSEKTVSTRLAHGHCLFPNTPPQAMRIRETLLARAFRLARGHQETLSIATIGGGAIGVELAAEIRDAMDALWQPEPGLDRDRVRSVIEGANRLLAANPPEMSRYAAASLPGAVSHWRSPSVWWPSMRGIRPWRAAGALMRN
ncbi:NADH dehydrogenase FAD-containing subunit [Variovorax boronicumulans]|uniref:hypothetical protein n=1 Tax=Variovorax boronicumulans TaxID=436515 RepID=UPI00247585A9|nr:hypothetical protein [Variovorax boronicumulans]MDH6164901.1 NADH dehydrogenase FAD-containing subunit [Variovorax boronicumulans]